ncbi:hypothetical protein KCP75_18925 [Salmonella enterica subsp. enterica]|nr:hypothetical protein KCP75_18925 [Salmonella enterica subsp. enterica]
MRTRWEEFTGWSGFGGALDMLEDAAGGGGGDPQAGLPGAASLNTLRDGISQINGIDEVRMDDSWFARGGAHRAGGAACRRR